MEVDFLHNHPEFDDLIQIVSGQLSVAPVLVEKDYWIMQVLYGLQELEFSFQMKGGTSLSKGYHLIDRFSEDIDILIEPPPDQPIPTGRNQNSPKQCQARADYYDWLSTHIYINGIHKALRDTNYDDSKYRSGGIRLHYQSTLNVPDDIKQGILLEVGFDDVTPNQPRTISSWVYDFAVDKILILDNRAKDVPCYHPGYTLVEKLQTISTKYRKQRALGTFSENFMRHYYDVYCLLGDPDVRKFLSMDAYHVHKAKRFRQDDQQVLALNDAFILADQDSRTQYERQYELSKSLYYRDKPPFEEILSRIQMYLHLM